MIPATAMMARRMSTTMAVAGRTSEWYAQPVRSPHSVKVCYASRVAGVHRTGSSGGRECGEWPRNALWGPPTGGGGPDYMKDGSPPWGGLGGYPFTPWERALGARGGTILPACDAFIGHGEWFLESFIREIFDEGWLSSL